MRQYVTSRKTKHKKQLVRLPKKNILEVEQLLKNLERRLKEIERKAELIQADDIIQRL